MCSFLYVGSLTPRRILSPFFTEGSEDFEVPWDGVGLLQSRECPDRGPPQGVVPKYSVLIL